MSVPYKFRSGEVARAQEINANFQYISTLLGTLSSSGKLSPPGELVLGPRGTAMFTNRQDTGADGNRYLQIGWNTDWIDSGSKGFLFERILINNPATALRIGADGVTVRSTSKTTGNLNSQMVVRFKLWTVDTASYIYLEDGLRFTSQNRVPQNLEEERLTYVILNRPRPIYNKVSVKQGSSTATAYDYGIPKHARAIEVRAHVTATWVSGAGLLIYQRASPGGTIKEKGMVAHATWTSHAGTRWGMRTGASGIVPLGEGPYAGQFVIERTASFEEAIVHIVGYYT